MEEFLKTQPILWIPSDVWFGFLDRRLGILADTHGKIYENRPPNYGVLSGLFANLMQSVIFTPPVVNTFVRESLAALEYKRHCDSDGMFFLHTFDLSKQPCLMGIQQRDDSSIKRFLGGGLPKPGARFVRESLVGEVEEGDETYPLGRTPTWAQIKLSFLRTPFELMPKWIFPAELKSFMDAEELSIERKACMIFVKFCRALWVILHPAWMRPETSPIKPRTIEQALGSWSVDSVCERMENIKFRPCNSGFRDVSGQPMLPFEDRWEIYFPDEGVVLKKRWGIFAEESGYLHLYHAEARCLGTDDTQELNRCLGVLLSHCQCLPDSDLPAARDNIWRVDQQQMVLLANPKHYKIAGVASTKGNGGNRAPRAPAAHRLPKDAQIQFLIQEGYTAVNSTRAVKMKAASIRNVARRSNKAKNARQPPKRINRKQVSDEKSSSSKEAENQGYEPEDRSNDEDYYYSSEEKTQSKSMKHKAHKPLTRRNKKQIAESDDMELSEEQDEEVEDEADERGGMADDEDDNPYDM